MRANSVTETNDWDAAPGGPEVSVAVRGLAAGGAMVGRVVGPEDADALGMTAFVPFAAPGETVRARVVKRAQRYLEAELTAVGEPSPGRVEPPCPYFGTCGGCDLQHLSYEAQLAAKKDMVVGAFRVGKFDEETLARIGDVVPSPPYEYRQRVTLHISKGRAGYYRRRSRRLLPVTACPISVPAIGAKLADALELGAISDGELILDAGNNGVFATLYTEKVEAGDRRDLLRWLRSRFDGGVVVVGGKVTDTFGADAVERPLEGVAPDFRMAVGEFAQSNATINTSLVRKVVSVAEETGAATACDLYAGSGNFAFPLAARGLPTVAVEESAALVNAGRAEAARLGLDETLKFQQTTVERFLLREPPQADLVIADPPRGGLEKLAPRFDFSPHLILISCDLASAVRDLRELTATGWRVLEILPHDMFAQTGHVELLTRLTRTTPSPTG
jgi:23S rRNA (uracil1939-C5)-methyltransferase